MADGAGNAGVLASARGCERSPCRWGVRCGGRTLFGGTRHQRTIRFQEPYKVIVLRWVRLPAATSGRSSRGNDMLFDVRRHGRNCLALAGITALTATAAVLGVGADDPPAAAAAVAEARPNIVLLLLDDARRGDLTAAPSIKRRVGGRG